MLSHSASSSHIFNGPTFFLQFNMVCRNLCQRLYSKIIFGKSHYEELISELKIEEHSWNFDAVFNHFKDDKIDVSNGKIRFSHPSYFEAIKHIISENSFTAKTEQILCNTSLKLANNND